MQDTGTGDASKRLPPWHACQPAVLTEDYAADEEGDCKSHVVQVSNDAILPPQLLRLRDKDVVAMHTSLLLEGQRL